jgi:hypothetical protein
MDQISIKTPGVYLSEAPDPLPLPVTHFKNSKYTYPCTYSDREGGAAGK